MDVEWNTPRRVFHQISLKKETKLSVFTRWFFSLFHFLGPFFFIPLRDKVSRSLVKHHAQFESKIAGEKKTKTNRDSLLYKTHTHTRENQGCVCVCVCVKLLNNSSINFHFGGSLFSLFLVFFRLLPLEHQSQMGVGELRRNKRSENVIITGLDATHHFSIESWLSSAKNQTFASKSDRWRSDRQSANPLMANKIARQIEGETRTGYRNNNNN